MKYTDVIMTISIDTDLKRCSDGTDDDEDCPICKLLRELTKEDEGQ